MTSLTIIVPDWLAWVVVGALVVNTTLTIISIRLRVRFIKKSNIINERLAALKREG